MTVLYEAQRHVGRVHRHTVAIVQRRQRQFHRHAVYGADALLAKLQRGGHHDVQRLAAQHLAVGHSLHLHIAHSGCGEHTVADRANAAVGHPEGRPLRQCRGVAGGADAAYGNGQGRAHGEIVIVRRNDGVVKLVGGLGRRYHHQRGADGTGIAVGGTVHDRQIVVALLLGHERGRAAAVKIHGHNAPGVEHDLSNLNGAAAGRHGLLTAVHDHQHHAVVRRDAHAGTGGTAVIIIAAVSDDQFAVLHQQDAGTYGLCNVVFTGGVIRGAADDGGAVLEDGEEIFTARAVVLNTFHDQRTGGSTVGHVVEVGVHAHHRRVVGDIQIRVLRVGVARLGGVHLILHARHAPRCAHIVLVVGIDSHVTAGHVRRRNVIHQRLAVCGRGAAQRLGNAGRQRGGLAGIHGIVLVAGLVGDGARQRIQVVGKGIAAGRAQVVQIRQSAAAFQRGNGGVALVSGQHGGAKLLLGAGAGETAAQQEVRAELIRQAAVEIVGHDGADGLAARQVLHDVISVQITVQIQHAEAVHIVILGRIVVAQVLAVGAQLIGHLLHGGGRDGAVLLGIVHEVTDVAAPAAKVSVGHGGGSVCLHGVIGDIHAAEHVHKVHLVAVGQGEFLQAAQRGSAGAIGRILLRHIGSEIRLFLAGQHGPGAAGVFVHAAADVVNDQAHSVLARVLAGIGLCIALQHLQVG